MNTITGLVAVALALPTGLVLGAGGCYVLVLRRRHGGAVPMPAWLIRAEHPSPALRELVARMARSAAKDAMADWDTLPTGLKGAIRAEVNRAAAAAFAAHDGRR